VGFFLSGTSSTVMLNSIQYQTAAGDNVGASSVRVAPVSRCCQHLMLNPRLLRDSEQQAQHDNGRPGAAGYSIAVSRVKSSESRDLVWDREGRWLE
jgi:hypothetical protein